MINCNGLVVQACLRAHEEGNVIINTTPALAYNPSPPSWLDYISTKGAIVSFTRGLGLYLINKKIRVNGVAPGPCYVPKLVKQPMHMNKS
ncbi:hypothetical protein R6Q59_013104 [Mikania micrantha]